MRVMAHLEGQTALPCDACLREQAKREEAEHQLWLANVKVEELMAQITGMQETIDDIKCNLPKTVKALLAFSPTTRTTKPEEQPRVPERDVATGRYSLGPSNLCDDG